MVAPRPWFHHTWLRHIMTAEERQQLNSLCQRIQDEKDQERFSQLLRELHDLLQRTEYRLEEIQPKPPKLENSK